MGGGEGPRWAVLSCHRDVFKSPIYPPFPLVQILVRNAPSLGAIPECYLEEWQLRVSSPSLPTPRSGAPSGTHMNQVREQQGRSGQQRGCPPTLPTHAQGCSSHWGPSPGRGCSQAECTMRCEADGATGWSEQPTGFAGTQPPRPSLAVCVHKSESAQSLPHILLPRQWDDTKASFWLHCFT